MNDARMKQIRELMNRDGHITSLTELYRIIIIDVLGRPEATVQDYEHAKRICDGAIELLSARTKCAS